MRVMVEQCSKHINRAGSWQLTCLCPPSSPLTFQCADLGQVSAVKWGLPYLACKVHVKVEGDNATKAGSPVPSPEQGPHHQLLSSFSGRWLCLLIPSCPPTTNSMQMASPQNSLALASVGVKSKLCVFLFVFLFSRSGWRSLCRGRLSEPHLWAGKWRRAMWLHRAAPLWKQWVTPATSPSRQTPPGRSGGPGVGLLGWSPCVLH